MKRTRNKRDKAPPHPALDLFGEVPVTWPEVELWCRAVAGIDPDSWRFAYYVRGWNVVRKIQMAKMEGQFEAIISPASLERERRGTLVFNEYRAAGSVLGDAGHHHRLALVAAHNVAVPRPKR